MFAVHSKSMVQHGSHEQYVCYRDLKNGETEISGLTRYSGISGKHLIEDLNGSRHPHGIVKLFLHHYHVADSSGVLFNYAPYRDAYIGRLRACVDLWLATGRRKDGTDEPSKRKPTPAISFIVEGVVDRNIVLPAAMKDGYAIAIQPNFDVIPLASDANETLPDPSSKVNSAEYPELEDYAAALLKEKFAPGKIAERQAHLEPAKTPEPGAYNVAEYERRLACNAAEIVFTQMLMSECRLKVARCANPACGWYFQLGKWNQPYGHGTLCGDCRLDRKADRVETGRNTSKKGLRELAAETFSSSINRDALWFRDMGLKTKIARVLNAHIADPGSGQPIKTSYPRGITTKWITRGENQRAISKLAKRKKHEQKGCTRTQ